VTAAPAVQRETVGLMVVAVLVLLMALVGLVLLPAGDEGRQAVDITIGGCGALRALLMLLALLMLREGLRIARDIRLRLAGAVRRIGGAGH